MSTAFAQARDLIRQLTLQEQLYLLNDLTAQLIARTPQAQDSQREPLPLVHLAQWPDDLPLRREDLYDDRGR